ncbi:hypothetical protein NZ47_08410 [Anaerovibrio lipolyticus]|uniref:NERD domain-containing protein n=1 Tax=Anaerovibrio lipolyticus TaxID=82374 RepID=A0A0B2JYX2_9FIRM|nr:hypothetical protein [Anaerovibrio lipolyticus]KHM51786.1 hypothetical protein NZ47_08410 [Anaerovibrio lipolyticus]
MAEIKRPRFIKSNAKKKWLIVIILGILFSILGVRVFISPFITQVGFFHEYPMLMIFVGLITALFGISITEEAIKYYREADTAEYDDHDTTIDFRLNELIPEYGVVEKFIMEKRTKLKFSHVVIGKNGVFAIRVMSFPNCIIDTTSNDNWTLMPIINGNTFRIRNDNHVKENSYFTEWFRCWCRERCDLYEYDEEDIFALTLFIDCMDINNRVQLPESGEPSVFFSKDALIDYIRSYKPHQEVSASKINYLVNKFKEHKDK